MKDEIKVGEYIRTPYFTIEKVEKINKAEKNIYEDIVITDTSAYGLSWLKKHKTKHSSNIIDLIEKGDYVNGFLIDYINLDCKVPFLRSERPYREATTWYKDLIEKGKDYNMCLHFKQEDIKSIVTKEQFKSVEYEV